MVKSQIFLDFKLLPCPECCMLSSYLPAYEDGTDSVPKRQPIKFRRRGNYPEESITTLKFLFLHVIIHFHLFSVQDNKASFEKLIQSMRHREAAKKTVAKRKLILSDEGSDSEDKDAEAQLQNVSGLKCTMENLINTIDEEDAVEKGCGSLSTIIEDVSDDDRANDEMTDMNYEADTDEAPSPVLGRNVATNSSRMETEKHYKVELSLSLTPDMSAKSTSRSSTKKCNSAALQSKDIETDENSETGSKQTISIHSQHMHANVRTTHCALLTLSGYFPYVHITEVGWVAQAV